MREKSYKFFTLSLLIILIDQLVKIIVYNFMDLGITGQIPVFGDWFKLHYTLNPGMAFGMQLGSSYGKLVLTIFRLFAMVGIAYYLIYLSKKTTSSGIALVCSFNSWRRCGKRN